MFRKYQWMLTDVIFFLHNEIQWYIFISYTVPCLMPFCQSVLLLQSVTWQQNVKDYCWEGSTSTVPPCVSDVMDQYTKTEHYFWSSPRCCHLCSCLALYSYLWTCPWVMKSSHVVSDLFQLFLALHNEGKEQFWIWNFRVTTKIHGSNMCCWYNLISLCNKHDKNNAVIIKEKY